MPNEPISGKTPGAMQYADGGQASMMPPTPMVLDRTPVSAPAPTASPAPVAAAPAPITLEAATNELRNRARTLLGQQGGTTTPEPTVGETLGFSNPTYQESLGPFEGSILDTRITDDENDSITRNQMRLFQGQIDATNQIYDQMLNEARLEGQGRLGSQRAMASRGGLLGSDFGASQKQKVQSFNTDINRGIQAERQAAVGAIMGTMRQSVQQQRAEKRAAKEQGAENYLNYLKNESTIRQGNVNLAAQSMLAQGIDPTTLDENELAAIANEAGISTGDIITQYQILAQQAQAEGAESSNFGFMSSSGGIFRTDPTTGEATFIPSGGGATSGGSSSGATFTSTQRNKLEAAGLSDAPRSEQLDYLFGDDQDNESVEQINTYLETNRNQDPERLRQDLLNQGFSVSLVNSYLETRPMSNRDVQDMATAFVSEKMNPSLWKSRSVELEEAKQAAIEELNNEFSGGALFDLFGERTKQLTAQEYDAIVAEINKLSGRETANSLIK